MKNEKKLLIYLIAGITFVRLIYVNFVPLVPQEAYYWKYAKNLALSYLDHPPMTAYTIAFFTWIGGDNIFFIRLGSIVFSIGLMVLLYLITNQLFKNHKWSTFTILAVNCTVIFSIGSTIITPDVPLLFFWSLVVYSLVQLLNSNHWKWWYLAGLAFGFGLLSKYTAILIIPGIFIYLLITKSQTRWLKTVHPYLGIVLALIIFSPVIIWNYQNNWSSFLFQSSNRFSQMIRFRPEFFAQLIGSQLGMLTPYLFFLIIFGWFRIGILSFKEKNEKYSLLFWIAFPVYFIFVLSSFRSLVKMNWLAPAYITSIIAGIVWINSSNTKWSNRFKKWLRPGLILGLVIVLFMHLLPIVPMFPIRKGDSWTGWQELANRTMEIKKEMGEDTFIFGHEYKIPSEITFYTANH
ncbi:MAG: glycosyltransferase family 39 protein, partial [bacterium]